MSLASLEKTHVGVGGVWVKMYANILQVGSTTPPTSLYTLLDPICLPEILQKVVLSVHQCVSGWSQHAKTPSFLYHIISDIKFSNFKGLHTLKYQG
jgi:hypothetical protein